jgi:hypothetical protein
MTGQRRKGMYRVDLGKWPSRGGPHSRDERVWGNSEFSKAACLQAATLLGAGNGLTSLQGSRTRPNTSQNITGRIGRASEARVSWAPSQTSEWSCGHLEARGLSDRSTEDREGFSATRADLQFHGESCIQILADERDMQTGEKGGVPDRLCALSAQRRWL